MSKRTIVDILSDPAITPDLLRARAKYWRSYAERTLRYGNVKKAATLRANCRAMLALARTMERPPGPAPTLLPVHRPAKARKPAALGAEAFWDAMQQAKSAAVAELGPRWKWTAQENCVALHIPAHTGLARERSGRHGSPYRR